jgi:6-phosphogluconolactonase
MLRSNTAVTVSLLFTLGAVAPAQSFGFGAVYAQTNATTGNEVKVMLRLPGGALIPFADFATTGTGTGGSLGSQGAVALSGNGRWLLATDAGSGEVTLFRVFGGLFLWRSDTDASGGSMPTSVAVHGNLVYVLNAGSDSITGFRIQAGALQPIPAATYPLSQSGAQAAQVGFSPDGDFVVVTERATNRIGVFAVQVNGTLTAGQFQPSAGQTPFGFLFRDDGALVVSEAEGGAPGASVTSSYRIQPNGMLMTISTAVPTNQTAACWVAIPRHGDFAYVTNTGSGTITGYSIDSLGTLAILNPNGVTGNLGATAAPIDFDFDRHGRFLYVLDSAGDRIRAFHRNNNGSLTQLPVSVSVPDGAAGLIAR